MPDLPGVSGHSFLFTLPSEAAIGLAAGRLYALRILRQLDASLFEIGLGGRTFTARAEVPLEPGRTVPVFVRDWGQHVVLELAGDRLETVAPPKVSPEADEVALSPRARAETHWPLPRTASGAAGSRVSAAPEGTVARMSNESPDPVPPAVREVLHILRTGRPPAPALVAEAGQTLADAGRASVATAPQEGTAFPDTAPPPAIASTGAPAVVASPSGKSLAVLAREIASRLAFEIAPAPAAPPPTASAPNAPAAGRVPAAGPMFPAAAPSTTPAAPEPTAAGPPPASPKLPGESTAPLAPPVPPAPPTPGPVVEAPTAPAAETGTPLPEDVPREAAAPAVALGRLIAQMPAAILDLAGRVAKEAASAIAAHPVLARLDALTSLIDGLLAPEGEAAEVQPASPPPAQAEGIPIQTAEPQPAQDASDAVRLIADRVEVPAPEVQEETASARPDREARPVAPEGARMIESLLERAIDRPGAEREAVRAELAALPRVELIELRETALVRERAQIDVHPALPDLARAHRALRGAYARAAADRLESVARSTPGRAFLYAELPVAGGGKVAGARLRVWHRTGDGQGRSGRETGAPVRAAIGLSLAALGEVAADLALTETGRALEPPRLAIRFSLEDRPQRDSVAAALPVLAERLEALGFRPELAAAVRPPRRAPEAGTPDDADAADDAHAVDTWA